MKRTKLYVLGLLITTCSFSACLEAAKKGGRENTRGPFYDVNTFFHAEEERLQSVERVEKRLSFENKVEEKVIEDWDPGADLQPFKELNLNKASWFDKYTTDSIPGENGYRLIYTATKKKLRIRQMEVEIESGEVVRVEVKKLLESPIATMEQELEYLPEEGFTIRTMQDLFTARPKESTVEVDWGVK